MNKIEDIAQKPQKEGVIREKKKLKNNFIILLTIYSASILYNILIVVGTIEHNYPQGAGPVHALFYILAFVFVYQLADLLYKKWYISLIVTIILVGLMNGWLGILFWGTVFLDAFRKIKGKEAMEK